MTSTVTRLSTMVTIIRPRRAHVQNIALYRRPACPSSASCSSSISPSSSAPVSRPTSTMPSRAPYICPSRWLRRHMATTPWSRNSRHSRPAWPSRPRRPSSCSRLSHPKTRICTATLHLPTTSRERQLSHRSLLRLASNLLRVLARYRTATTNKGQRNGEAVEIFGHFTPFFYRHFWDVYLDDLVLPSSLAVHDIYSAPYLPKRQTGGCLVSEMNQLAGYNLEGAIVLRPLYCGERCKSRLCFVYLLTIPRQTKGICCLQRLIQ